MFCTAEVQFSSMTRVDLGRKEFRLAEVSQSFGSCGGTRFKWRACERVRPLRTKTSNISTYGKAQNRRDIISLAIWQVMSRVHLNIHVKRRHTKTGSHTILSWYGLLYDYQEDAFPRYEPIQLLRITSYIHPSVSFDPAVVNRVLQFYSYCSTAVSGTLLQCQGREQWC